MTVQVRESLLSVLNAKICLKYIVELESKRKMDTCPKLGTLGSEVDECVRGQHLMPVLVVTVYSSSSSYFNLHFFQNLCNQPHCSYIETLVPAGQHTFLKGSSFSSVGSFSFKPLNFSNLYLILLFS